MATFMAAMESSIVATAMPSIVAALGGFRLFSWAFAAYLPPTRFDDPDFTAAWPISMAASGFFTPGPVCFWSRQPCAGSPGRWCRWCCSAPCRGRAPAPFSRSLPRIIGDVYEPQERARIQGYISGAFGVAALIGPMLGAFLVQHVTWSLCSGINLPIGAITFVMFGLFLHDAIVYLALLHPLIPGSALMMLGAGASEPTCWSSSRILPYGRRSPRVGQAAATRLRCWRRMSATQPVTGSCHCGYGVIWVIAVGSLSGLTAGIVMMSINGFLPLYVQGAYDTQPDPLLAWPWVLRRSA